ncbi:MAG: hypothetical protein ACXACC_06255 [Promethearchaeota archaeon]|jgi:hypothetical protein
MSEAPKGEISASKVIAFIGMLTTVYYAMLFFYGVTLLTGIFVLWGIICLLIAFLIFITIGLISFGPLSKVPYKWWILLIFGAVLLLIAYISRFPLLSIGYYLPAILILMAALIELIMQKKPYKASKMVAIVGAGFAAYECIVLFLIAGPPRYIINGIFGLALIIILLLLIFEVVDFKLFDYSWWIVLLIGFVIYTWVSPLAGGFPVVGYGGTIILIAFILILMAF